MGTLSSANIFLIGNVLIPWCMKMEGASLLFFTQMPNELTNTEMGGSSRPLRCCNIDWLEVFAREPITVPHDAAYWRAHGFVVREREYGTRVYKEMFVLDGTDGRELLEIRRHPASSGLYGIHDENETHIRLVNRSCYFEGVAGRFSTFLAEHGYFDIRISRVDVCLDFVRFDSGDDPARFVRRYFEGVFRKINQGNITSHGKDGWEGQDWNSLSWGSPHSDVGTKMYNKTMELFDAKNKCYKKPYILQAWRECGLIDDVVNCTLGGTSVQVWRVEFSIRSSVKRWFTIWLDGKKRQKQSIMNTLDMYDSRSKLITMFASLQQHYFRFKYYEPGKRKDRCRDKDLFKWTGLQFTYKIEKNDTVMADDKSSDKTLTKLLCLLKTWASRQDDPALVRSVSDVVSSLEAELKSQYFTTPLTKQQTEYMQRLLLVTKRLPHVPVDFLMQEVAKNMNIKDRTLSLQEDTL